jgi:predicted enzyme related to lactoylglutathione lyase
MALDDFVSDFNSKHNRLVWFDIPVADLDRSRAFYQAVLGIAVHREKFGDYEFCVLDHQDGNGGCLVKAPGHVTASGGVLCYLNVDGRIRDAVAHVGALGGKVVEPVHAIGPHGFRALVLDSEGNRIALHSTSDR